mgnify:CR=1 FL=1|tara:strand:- start:4435 stop:4659 length:225 start_codon:yes stop_codon:yes gene_type:complete
MCKTINKLKSWCAGKGLKVLREDSHCVFAVLPGEGLRRVQLANDGDGVELLQLVPGVAEWVVVDTHPLRVVMHG